MHTNKDTPLLCYFKNSSTTAKFLLYVQCIFIYLNPWQLGKHDYAYEHDLYYDAAFDKRIHTSSFPGQMLPLVEAKHLQTTRISWLTVKTTNKHKNLFFQPFSSRNHMKQQLEREQKSKHQFQNNTMCLHGKAMKPGTNREDMKPAAQNNHCT